MMKIIRLSFILLLFFFSGNVIGQSKSEVVIIELNSISSILESDNIKISQSGIQVRDKGRAGIFISQEIPVSLKEVSPFLAFSFSVSGVMISEDNSKFQIRINNKNGWSAWEEIHYSHEFEKSDNSFNSELVFYDLSVRAFQLKVEVNKNTEKQLVFKDLRFNLFSPGENTSIKNTVSPDPSYDCYCPLPAFITRTQWNCPDGQEPSCSPPSYTNVTHLVIHHSATSNTSGNWPAVVLSFWDYHVNGHGWCDIGYNWLVDPEGNLYEGRGGGNNVRGAHFSCVNSNTMGVCMIGDFTEVEPTPEAKEKLQRLLAWKCCNDDLDPLAVVYHPPSELYLPVICGHRDGNSSPAPGACPSGTSCPGDMFYPQLPDIRNGTNDLINSLNCGNIVPPLNDSCSNAQAIEYSSDCEMILGDVSGATPSGVSAASCSDYSGFPALEDVWFSFVADTTAYGIKVQSSESFDAVLALYDTCNGEELACSDHGGGVGDIEFIDYENYVTGNMYYIRVYHYGAYTPDTPTFEICLSNLFHYPVANFYASSSTGSAPFEVDFIDQSTANPINWNWVFEGGIPEESTDQNPLGILYEEEGLYNVSLLVTNEYGEHELVKEEYIEVNPNGINKIFNTQVRIYPNPASEKINVVIPPKSNAIQLVNQYGQVLEKTESPLPSSEIDLSKYPDGLYFIRVYRDKEIINLKVIKQ